ncbi:MAG: thioesterase family protein [Eubacteriales bacterium]|nr:thioesterase family protein [Eubacteriales bacterium]
MKPVIYSHKAQYYETDRMGIIHHSNYIRWFEECRCFLMEQMGYSYERLEEEGIISPVLEIECQYRSMVRFGDTVDISAVIKEFNGIRLTLAYEVRNHKDGALCTTGISRHCFLGPNGRPVFMKKAKPEFYQRVLAFMEDE